MTLSDNALDRLDKIAKENTKTELVADIRRLQSNGDALFEWLEILATNPVVRAHFEEIARLTGPVWVDAIPTTETLKADVREWNNLVGDLQRRGVVGPFPEEASIVYTSDEEIVEWYDE